jgi:FixJ family two-component response regulator
MTQKNKDIRREIIKAGLYNYEVAEAMGVSETYFSRLLHSTLLPSKITSLPPVPA